ncbi:hypothetical protein JCM8097_008820 [Rhodosporidiobolus ruineniae]
MPTSTSYRLGEPRRPRLPSVHHLFAAAESTSSSTDAFPASSSSYPYPPSLSPRTTYSTSFAPAVTTATSSTRSSLFSSFGSSSHPTESPTFTHSPLSLQTQLAPPSLLTPAPSPQSLTAPWQYQLSGRRHSADPVFAPPPPSSSSSGTYSTSYTRRSSVPEARAYPSHASLARSTPSEQELLAAALTLSDLSPPPTTVSRRSYGPWTAAATGPSSPAALSPPSLVPSSPPTSSRQTRSTTLPPITVPSGASSTSYHEDTGSSALPKRFPCGSCSARFARRNDLTRHERIHTGEEPFECRLGCGTRFRRSDARKRHEAKADC